MCVLRVAGENFDPVEFLAGSELTAEAVFVKGQPRRSFRPDGEVHESSGMNVGVSDAEWSGLNKQVMEAERFLEKNRADLKRLHSLVGDGVLTLDFPLELRIDDECWSQFDKFPVSIVRLAGEIGIALETSLYPVSDDDDEAEDNGGGPS